MHCSQCQELLSEYIDGMLELGEQTKIEGHMLDCGTCRDVRDDLLQIVHFSKNLPLHTPSSALWVRIKTEIEADVKVGFRPRVGAWWAKMRPTSLRVRAEWAAAAAILISLSAVVYVLQTRPVPTYNRTADQAQVLVSPDGSSVHQDAVDSNIRDMEQRINNLKAAVEERSVGWNPQIRSTFNRDMLYIDQTLAECHHDLSDNPQDAVCRELMLNAYREKVRLLEGFNDF